MVLIRYIGVLAVFVVSWAGFPAEGRFESAEWLQKVTGGIFKASSLKAAKLLPTGNEDFDKRHIWYRVDETSRGLCGYLCYGQAKGRYEYFDYVAVFDTERVLRFVKITAYRSDYGYGIQNQAWLRQLVGWKPGHPLEYGKNVDALSGATLSGHSLVEDLKAIGNNFPHR